MFALDEVQNKEPVASQEITPALLNKTPLLPNPSLPAWPYKYFNQYPLPYFPMLFNSTPNFGQLMNKHFANDYKQPVSIFYANQSADAFRIIVDREYYNKVYAK